MAKEILRLFGAHSSYVILTLGVILFGIVLTFIVNFAAGQLKFAKYIPGLILVFIGIFSLFLVINRLFETSSLDNLIVFVTGVSAGVVSLIFALMIGIASSDRNHYATKPKRKPHSQEE